MSVVSRLPPCAMGMNGLSTGQKSAYELCDDQGNTSILIVVLTDGSRTACSPTTSLSGAELRYVTQFVLMEPSRKLHSQGGFTVILVPRCDNVETKGIKTAYSTTAGTAYVILDDVRVPVSYTLGEVNNGMKVILSNFNHERWMMCCTSLSAQRKIVEECMKWANQRIVFGKPLNAQAVIRAKLANMIARVEAGQNWLELITHQMNNVGAIPCSLI